MKDFPCTSCGLCCKQIGLILTNKTQLPELQQFLLSKFPYKALEDGSCEMLNKDNQLGVKGESLMSPLITERGVHPSPLPVYVCHWS